MNPGITSVVPMSVGSDGEAALSALVVVVAVSRETTGLKKTAPMTTPTTRPPAMSASWGRELGGVLASSAPSTKT